jgi:NTE family protein
VRALVLSGGANKGAYQAGVLYHLLYDLSIHYNIICGVSVGALNGSYLAMHPKGEESLAADGLRQLWQNLRNEDVYKRWPLGLLQAIWKPSLYDSSPLRHLINRKIDPKRIGLSGKRLRVGATCLGTGEYHVFHQSYEHLVKAVMASCAFPGAFEPVELAGGLWVDGGVRDVTPLKAAIDAGATRIDVLNTSPPFSAPFRSDRARFYEIVFRSVEVMSDEVLANDLSVAQGINSLVEVGAGSNFRHVSIHVLRPEEPLEPDSFDFSKVTCRALWARGYTDSLCQLEQNPSFLTA